jgi:hypothetical protein
MKLMKHALLFEKLAPAALIIRSGMILLVALLGAGCETAREYSLTYKLWDKGAGPSCRPALEPELAVFVSHTAPDVLVTYNALDERADTISRRAYFLHTNETRIALRQKPLYVQPSLATNMRAVPIVRTTNAALNAGMAVRYPVSTANGSSFELYRDGRSEGTHDLPVFNAGVGTAARVALTPPVIVGDTLMAGATVAVLGAILWVSAGCPPFSNQ